MFGVAFGIMLSMGAAKILSLGSGAHPLVINTISSGDIKVQVQESGADQTQMEFQDSNQDGGFEVWMTRDDVPFLLLNQDEDGQTSALYLLGAEKRPIVWMEQGSSGKWQRATYSSNFRSPEHHNVLFHDIDFDGQFDFKLTADGKEIARYILLDDAWAKVNSCSTDAGAASIDDYAYVFDVNTGLWRAED